MARVGARFTTRAGDEAEADTTINAAMEDMANQNDDLETSLAMEVVAIWEMKMRLQMMMLWESAYKTKKLGVINDIAYWKDCIYKYCRRICSAYSFIY